MTTDVTARDVEAVWRAVADAPELDDDGDALSRFRTGHQTVLEVNVDRQKPHEQYTLDSPADLEELPQSPATVDDLEVRRGRTSVRWSRRSDRLELTIVAYHQGVAQAAEAVLAGRYREPSRAYNVWAFIAMARYVGLVLAITAALNELYIFAGVAVGEAVIGWAAHTYLHGVGYSARIRLAPRRRLRDGWRTVERAAKEYPIFVGSLLLLAGWLLGKVT